MICIFCRKLRFIEQKTYEILFCAKTFRSSVTVNYNVIGCMSKITFYLQLYSILERDYQMNIIVKLSLIWVNICTIGGKKIRKMKVFV